MSLTTLSFGSESDLKCHFLSQMPLFLPSEGLSVPPMSDEVGNQCRRELERTIWTAFRPLTEELERHWTVASGDDRIWGEVFSFCFFLRIGTSFLKKEPVNWERLKIKEDDSGSNLLEKWRSSY